MPPLHRGSTARRSPISRRLPERNRDRGQRRFLAPLRSHRARRRQGVPDPAARQRHGRRCRPVELGHLRLLAPPRPPRSKRAITARRLRRLPGAGRSRASGSRGLHQRGAAGEGPASPIPEIYRPAAGARPLRALGATGRGGDGSRDRDRQEPRHGQGVSQRPQRRQPVDARRLRAASAGHGLVRVLRRRRGGKPGVVRRLAARRRDRRGGLDRIAVAGDLEGLPALSCHRPLRRCVAAGLRRAGPADARCRRGRLAAGPACAARARGDAVGHERSHREDVHRSLFSARGEDPHRGDRGQSSHCGQSTSRRGDLDVAQRPEGGPGHAQDAICRYRLPGKWQDYSDLVVDSADALATSRVSPTATTAAP